MSALRTSLVLIIAAAGLAGTWAVAGESPAEPAARVTGRAATSQVGYDGSLLIQMRVADLDRAIAFYTKALDFELYLRDDDLRWAKLKTGVGGVIIGVGEGPEVAGSGTTSLNFGVRDIDSARRVLEDRGVTFVGETITIPGVVRLATFTDPDGNRIRLAGDPPPPHK